MQALKKGLSILLNIFFPPRCAFCLNIMEYTDGIEKKLCKECLKKINFIGQNSCNYCGKSLQQNKECICDLYGTEKYFSKVYSACEYHGLLREKLLDLKFGKKKSLAKIFAGFVIQKMEMTTEAKFDIIISVPMDIDSIKKRGYNQSEVIAEEVAKHFNKPCHKNVLAKSKIIQTQSKLDRKKRIENVKGAFCVINEEKVVGKNVLLIDDILTTGSTANECSKVLKEAGAKEVIVLTVATGKLLAD